MKASLIKVTHASGLPKIITLKCDYLILLTFLEFSLPTALSKLYLIWGGGSFSFCLRSSGVLICKDRIIKILVYTENHIWKWAKMQETFKVF